MLHDFLKRDLVQLDWEVTDRTEFFERMGRKLLRLGYVRDSFPAALEERERTYPTALPTQPEAIAIPHSDTEHVVTPFIASTRLAHPVTWHDMADRDQTHEVRFVFVLGFTQDDGHVKVLQILLEAFQDPRLVPALESARTEDDYFAVLSTISDI